MSTKRKVASVLLTSLLLLSLLISVFVLQSKATETNYSFEQYKADYYISGSDYYLSSNFTLPYRTIVEENRKNTVYRGLIYSWQLATFELSDVSEFSRKKAGYYEAFLFDVLYNGYEPTNISDVLNKSVKAVQSSTAKKICNLTKWNIYELGSKKLSDMSADETDKLLKNLKSCGEVKEVMGGISNAARILQYASDVEDLIHKLSKVSVIAKIGNEYADVITAIGNNTSDASMKFACSELAAICGNVLSEEQIISLMTSELLATDLMDWALGEVWSKLLDNFGLYGIAVEVGQGLGKFTSGLLFSTDKTIETYYEMDALYDFENALTTVVKKCKSNYSSSNTIENAKKFNAAYEMLLGVYGLGCDISIQHSSNVNENGAFNLFVSWVTGNLEKFNNYKQSLNSIKSWISFQREYACGDLYNLYVDEYCTDTSSNMNITHVAISGNQQKYNSSFDIVDSLIFLTCNMKITDSLKLSGNLETYGNLIFTNGTLDLNGYSLTVNGDFTQTGGTVNIGAGTLMVGENYDLGTSASNEAYLVMINDTDLVSVGGNFTVRSKNYSNKLQAGTIIIKGDFTQKNGNNYDNFHCTGSHKVVFDGDTTQTIAFDSSSSCFNNVVFNNSDIVFNTNMPVKNWTLEKDQYLKNGLKINEVNSIASKGYDITIDGDAFINGSGTLNLTDCSFSASGDVNQTVVMNLTRSSYSVGGDSSFGKAITLVKDNKKNSSMTINGLCELGSSLSLNGNTVEIKRNLIQTGGTVDVGGGILTIGGNYDLGTSASTDAYITMINDNDIVDIGGNFTVRSYNGGYNNKLQAGTMTIKGDFSQKNGAQSFNFSCSGSHIVILDGDSQQTVSFESTSSFFNNLKLTKDIDAGYVFNPEKCWKTLYVNTDVKRITIRTSVNSIKPNDIFTLNAYVEGINKPSQEVIWSVQGNTDSNTSIDNYGILTVGTDEEANKITITAVSVADNAKSDSIELTVVHPEPVVLGIKINPALVSVVTGEQIQLEAITYGLYKPAQGATWSISGNTSSNTTINSNGLLTIANDETADKITVTATSTADPTKSASVTVDIYQIKIISTVSSVTVTMATGETQKLQAVVTGSNNPNQKVTWTIGGNESANTIINKNGELTIGNDETAKTIIVRATSVEDPEKYGEFAINIATSDEPQYQVGDTNLDGHITISDVTAIQRHIAELEVFTDEQLALADTNGDGSIDITDATHLQKYLAEFDGVVLGKS